MTEPYDPQAEQRAAAVQAAEEAAAQRRASFDLGASPVDPPPAVTDGPPDHPLASEAVPQDALSSAEPAPAQAAGVPLTGEPTPTVGPEDALDPHVKNAGDYTDRVEDAPHFTGEPIPEDERVQDGPVSRLVAQNKPAEQLLSDRAKAEAEAEAQAEPAERD